MKQITQKQMEQIALRDESYLSAILDYHVSDWIKENAFRIGAMETGKADKTYFGEYPKGWRSAMKADATQSARAEIIAKFKAENVLELDGALWLRDWTLIQQLEGTPS